MSKPEFTLTKQFKFEAAHQLPAHDGKCQRLHGHSWVGRVIVRGTQLHAAGPKVGMLMDFADIKAVIEPTVDECLDHHYLNDSLRMTNPTSERVAEFLFNVWKEKLPGLVAVEIDETCTSSCRYSR